MQMKKIIIMADGHGTRWNNYKNAPKHLAEIQGEYLIGRTVRLIHKILPSIDIIITSHDPRYDFPGSRRYEPRNNHYEIDRFTEELIEDNICFLYGDTFYTEDAIRLIIATTVNELLFFGNRKSIVAVKIKNANLFNQHRKQVKKLYLSKKLKKCTGWQVYQSFTQQLYGEEIDLSNNFVFVDNQTTDINTPEEYEMLRHDGIL